MSKDATKPGIGTEEAKDQDLDRQPKQVRKGDNTALAELDRTEQAKRKGQRKVK